MGLWCSRRVMRLGKDRCLLFSGKFSHIDVRYGVYNIVYICILYLCDPAYAVSMSLYHKQTLKIWRFYAKMGLPIFVWTVPLKSCYSNAWVRRHSRHNHSGKAYEGTCRIPRQNGDGRGIASARFVWIVKAIESATRPHVVCGY